MSEGKNPAKIIIMGMENAGKSTIVKILTQTDDKIPEEPPKMTATRGIERSSHLLFERQIMIWDFGGQLVYRNDYLTKAEVHFQEICIFFYVVDVQDYNLSFSSRMYFTAVFQLIRKYSPKAKIVFLFHKTDPGFDDKQNIKGKFLENVEHLLPKSEVTYSIYETTIFDTKSIKAAFSQEIQKIGK